VRSGLCGSFWGDGVFSPPSVRGRAQIGMRDGCYCFSKLSSCLPTHRLVRKGSEEEKGSRGWSSPSAIQVEHKRTDLRSISSYCSP
jgi:hypothetical protein